MKPSSSPGVIDRAGGLDAVLKTTRADYFTYLKLVAEVYGVLKLTAEAEMRVSLPIANLIDSSSRSQYLSVRVPSKMSNWHCIECGAESGIVNTLTQCVC